MSTTSYAFARISVTFLLSVVCSSLLCPTRGAQDVQIAVAKSIFIDRREGERAGAAARVKGDIDSTRKSTEDNLAQHFVLLSLAAVPRDDLSVGYFSQEYVIAQKSTC